MKSKEQAAEEYTKQFHKDYPDGMTVAPYCNDEVPETCFLAGWDAKANQDEERIKELEEKLTLAEWALLVYANKEHLFGPFAESEPGGKKMNVCRHIGQTAMEALAKIRGER